MQGYNDVTIKMQKKYNPVEAYTVAQQAEGSSGGSYYENIRIEWTSEGITGNTWHTGDPNSPFYNADENDILNAAEDGNLNEYFGPWVSDTTKDQELFISSIYGCWQLM